MIISDIDSKNLNEMSRTKRTLKRANTDAVTGSGATAGGFSNRQNQHMTKSSTSKDFLSKDEARRRMMSWRKTTSLRYSSTNAHYNPKDAKN